jgi:hypothetical protein
MKIVNCTFLNNSVLPGNKGNDIFIFDLSSNHKKPNSTNIYNSCSDKSGSIFFGNDENNGEELDLLSINCNIDNIPSPNSNGCPSP